MSVEVAIMKILVAYDGSPASEAALEEVIRRPWPQGTKVRLVTAVERPLPAPPPDGAVYGPLLEKMRSSLREEAYHRIQAALEKLKARPDLETSYELREGNAKPTLLEAIREWETDLVITGSHGASGLARLFLGSVSHALVTHAPCSVEVVKVPTPTS
jgi:nucleotide-binding universal stress UspA family protein